LKYTLNDETYTVLYKIEDDLYTFEFVDPSGNNTVETYTAGASGHGAGKPPPQNVADAPPSPPEGRERSNKE